METNNKTHFFPSSPIHPFDILVDELKARGISKKDFAAQLGMKASNFCRMLKTKGSMSSETAIKLEKLLGIPYSQWMLFQEEYIKDCVRLNVPLSDEVVKDKSYEDIYEKLNSILKPILERTERINSFIHNHRSNSNEVLSIEEVNSMENDIHQLGKTLCKVKL